MVTVDIFDKINTIGLDKFDDILLQLWMVFSELYCLLYNPASIAVLRKLKDMIFDNFKESMPMGILSIFKQFLEDIISKLVLSQFNAFLNKRLENCILCVWLAIGYDWLYSSRAILVSSPLCRLIQII